MSKVTHKVCLTALSAAAISLSAGSFITSDVNAKEYYAGKTLTMLVPNSAGGGLDLIIRAFAQHYAKHIPGNPTIVVKNMPGGGGTRSLNFLFSNAKPDGLTINWGSWNAAGVVSGRKGIKYTPEKFGFIGAGGLPFITLIRSDVKPGLKKATDVVKAAKFNLGGRSADRSLDLVGNMSLKMIGANHKFIGGYRGMGKIKPALLAGEVQAANMGYVGYHLFFKDGIVKNGKGIALWYSSSFDAAGNPVRNSKVKDSNLKPFHEVYKDAHGKLPSGALWDAYKWYNTSVASMSQTTYAPPGTPKEAIAALRKGYYATANDPAYVVPETKRIGIGLNFVSLERGQEIINTFRKVSPEVLAELSKISHIGITLKRKKRKKKK
jgi:hypothetical protein